MRSRLHPMPLFCLIPEVRQLAGGPLLCFRTLTIKSVRPILHVRGLRSSNDTEVANGSDFGE